MNNVELTDSKKWLAQFRYFKLFAATPMDDDYLLVIELRDDNQPGKRTFFSLVEETIADRWEKENDIKYTKDIKRGKTYRFYWREENMKC